MNESHPFLIDVHDMEETLQFYKNVFGFEKIFELAHPETGEPWIVYIQIAKGQFLELFYGGGKVGSKQSDESGFSHLCFAVDDVEACAERITELGYTLDIPPCVGCDHNKQTWVRDPNGIRIELMQVSEQSPHYPYM